MWIAYLVVWSLSELPTSIQTVPTTGMRVNQMPGAAGVVVKTCKACVSSFSGCSADSAARRLGISRQTLYRKLRD